jgi:hypothetical protein
MRFMRQMQRTGVSLVLSLCELKSDARSFSAAVCRFRLHASVCALKLGWMEHNGQ